MIKKSNNQTILNRLSCAVLDGGMGSLIFSRLADKGEKFIGIVPETLNITHSDLIKGIHCDYIHAGSDIILSNTFGANPYKLDDYATYIKAGISIAKSAAAESGKPILVGQDISSSGKIIGVDITFDEAYECFKRVVSAGEDADLIFIETITDLSELRAALLAAKENSDRVVMVSMSFEKNLRTFFGSHITDYIAVADGLGADAIGINCSLSADELYEHVKLLRSGTDKPIFVKPNAGLPILENGNTVYKQTAHQFNKHMSVIKSMGVNILGGCCGTTPQFIAAIANLKNVEYIKPQNKGVSGTIIIGERINPTGKPLLKAALKENNFDYVVEMAQEQISCGAHILDVNLGYNEINEYECMQEIIPLLNSRARAPLCIDSTNAKVIERALRLNCGNAIINSFNGKEESYTAILPLAAKYGAKVIGLCLDADGIAENVAKRIEIAKFLVEKAVSYGIKKENILIDTLTMAESTGRGNAVITLETLSKVKKLGVKTVLGVSNISFGMPNRDDINAAFLAKAIEAGLDYAIINPALTKLTGSALAYEFLSGAEGAAEKYIALATKAVAVKEQATATLKGAIISGRAADSYNLSAELLKTISPQDIIETEIMPALDKVGEDYERGKSFLPQLIAAAEAAKQAFKPINDCLKAQGKSGASGKRFVIATVEGDIHDIGKNIVGAVVANYGYDVIDLGKDVKIADVVAAVQKHYPCVLGLSALMTTTAVNMAKTIQAVKEKFKDITVLVGGAVLTKEYAEKIGGIYCVNANASLTELNKIFK